MLHLTGSSSEEYQRLLDASSRACLDAIKWGESEHARVHAMNAVWHARRLTELWEKMLTF